MGENELLAVANAMLVAGSVACMWTGRRAIARRAVRRHVVCMCTALALQAVFLVLFVLRFVRFGPTPFAGGPNLEIVYAVVLVTHEPIAVVSVPLVVAAAVLGIRGKILAHRQVAQLAYPIWLYASVTGVALWWLIYW